MKCTYTLINRKGVKIEFDSLVELDYALSNKIGSKIDESMSKGAFYFSMDPKTETEHKIEDLRKYMESKSKKIETQMTDAGDVETFFSIHGSMGVSEATSTLGEEQLSVDSEGNPITTFKALVTPFNKNNYFDERAYSKSVRETVEGDWNIQTEIGTIIHAIAESLINPEKPLNLTPEQKRLFEIREDCTVESVQNNLKAVITKIKEKHPGCSLFTEVPIMSKSLAECYHKTTNKKGEKLTSINGRIDLLVIDANGIAHIYDFKVSKKDVGTWRNQDNENIQLNKEWPTTKKLGIEYQMEFYRAMLEQWGIRVGSTSIIPIKVDFEYTDNLDDGSPVGLKGVISVGATDIITDSTVSGMQRHIGKIRGILPVEYVTDNIDGIKAIEEPMSKMFPTFTLTAAVKRKDSTVAWYRDHKVYESKPGSKQAEIGKYWFFDELSSQKDARIYANSEEELKSKLTSYIEKLNARNGDEIITIANQIESILSGSQEFDSFTFNTKSDEAKSMFKRIFGTYISEGPLSKWKFLRNETLLAAGVFVFEKDGFIEIVSINNNPLLETLELPKGKSILGATKRKYEVDEHEIMDATYGNIDRIKVMNLINSEYNKFKDYKINRICSYNIWESIVNEDTHEQLFDNFDKLCKEHNIPNNLKWENFTNLFEYTKTMIERLTGDDKMKVFPSGLRFSPDQMHDALLELKSAEERLKAKSEKLRTAIQRNKFDEDDPYQYAWMLLQDAKLKVQNYRIDIEPDPSAYLQVKGGVAVGINFTTSQMAPSKTAQLLGKIEAEAETRIRRNQLKYIPRFRKQLDALYKAKDRNQLIGGEVKYFDNMFEKIEGTDKMFRFKREDDPSLTKEERDFLLAFLDIWSEFKYKGDVDKIAEAKINGTYYDVPLKKASFQTQVHNKGIWTATKTSFNDTLNFLKIFEQQREEFKNSRNMFAVYNQYNIGSETRKSILNNNDITDFETNLEDLLLDIIGTHVRETEFNRIMPNILALKAVLQYHAKMFGQKTEELDKYIQKFLDLNLYSQPIMDENLHSVYKIANVAKNITSATVLGLNIKSGMRELMQGAWIHLSRTMAGMYGKDQFTIKDISKAWGIIFKLSINNPNLITLLDTLNLDYGMANAGMNAASDILSQSKTGIKNFNSDKLYFANQIPDAYHRLGILIAKMIHDGCWESHSADEDGIVIYDFTTDKRFSLLNDPSADKNSDAYKEQHALYLAMRDQFIREGFDIPVETKGEPIPPLPRAYTLQEGQSIKSFADLCFGHYDKNTQMLAKHMFFGTFALQFRTFLSAKLEQWILKPGTYDQGQYENVYDIDGVQLVRVYTFDENGIPSVEIKRKTDVGESEYFEPYKEWKGKFMEGMLYTLCDYGNSLLKWDIAKIKEDWKNPTKRANTYLLINDFILMSLLMWLVSLLFFSEDSPELGVMGSMTVSALHTSFSDGPIWSVATSMFGDLNPPMYSTLKSIWSNTGAVLSGKKGLFESAVNTFGVLKPLKEVEGLFE